MSIFILRLSKLAEFIIIQVLIPFYRKIIYQNSTLTLKPINPNQAMTIIFNHETGDYYSLLLSISTLLLRTQAHLTES